MYVVWHKMKLCSSFITESERKEDRNYKLTQNRWMSFSSWTAICHIMIPPFIWVCFFSNPWKVWPSNFLDLIFLGEIRFKIFQTRTYNEPKLMTSKSLPIVRSRSVHTYLGQHINQSNVDKGARRWINGQIYFQYFPMVLVQDFAFTNQYQESTFERRLIRLDKHHQRSQ